MKLLVDTHAFLWFMAGDARLTPTARRAIEDNDDGWWLSAASVWELSIKVSLKRLTLPASVSEYIGEKVQEGLRVLPVEWAHAAGVDQLPLHHRDPFDRLLVAQARAEHLALVTGDAVFSLYGVHVVWS